MRRLVLIFTLALLAPLQTKAEESQRDLGFNCGLNAAFIFLAKTGHHVPYAELVQEFERQNSPDSLLAIRNVLQSHGCPTVGIKAGPDYFLKNPGPAIVHLQLIGYGKQAENHFTYVVGATRQTGVEVLDPVFDIQEAAHISWGTFSTSFLGAALVPK